MASDKTRIAVLMGGLSTEHDVSLMSGKQVLDALQGESPLPVVIQKDRTWVVDGAAQPNVGRAVERILEQCDVAFIALHGPFGEDGTVQGLFESVGLAYTGSGVLGSALAMDKVRTKAFYRAHALPTPEFVVIEPRRYRTEKNGFFDLVESTLGFPCVIKPATLGSSFGVSFPADRGVLETAVEALIADRHEVLVEKRIQGRELTCGVLSIDAEAKTIALPITEIIPDAKYAFFDYEAKYQPGATNEVTPADIPESVALEVQRVALAAHYALGCRDMSRSDFMLGADMKPLIIETNTIPGFTKTSLLPQEAAYAGIDFRRLVRILVDNARARKTLT